MKITTIINYCTNDYMYLKSCVDGARPFSSKIIVPYCDHFHDGTAENKWLLNKSTAENLGVEFIEFEYEPTMTSRWHCNASRKIGIELASPDTEYFLLLDTDEIIESDKFIQWIEQQEKSKMLLDGYKLANYFYFRDFKYRAKNTEDSIVLIKNGPLVRNDALVFHDHERSGVFDAAPKKARNCMLDGKPFIHHYSWVRSKEAMLKKVTAWSHNADKNWVALVHKEFEAPFRGKDVIFGDNREYEVVEPYLNKFSVTDGGSIGIKILDNGSWNWNDSDEDHSQNLDVGLMNYLLEFLKDTGQKVIMDFGCATGYFLEYISNRTVGIELIGVEPHASKKTHRHFDNILDYNLGVPFELNKRGTVMCIEVLEHIPAEFESAAVDNVTRHCEKYLFISWAYRGQGGWGHFNEKDMAEVISIFNKKGFMLLEKETHEARNASTVSWIKKNFAIFQRA